VQSEGGAYSVRHPAGVPGIIPLCGHSRRLAHHVWRLCCACARVAVWHGECPLFTPASSASLVPLRVHLRAISPIQKAVCHSSVAVWHLAFPFISVSSGGLVPSDFPSVCDDLLVSQHVVSTSSVLHLHPTQSHTAAPFAAH